jgi:hypothetical protein
VLAELLRRSFRKVLWPSGAKPGDGARSRNTLYCLPIRCAWCPDMSPVGVLIQPLRKW